MNASTMSQREIAAICIAETNLDFAREVLELAADAGEREAAERDVKAAEAELARARSPWERGSAA
jgi:multidrug efflux pump subunit AcrA (membrane-fusion protein)